MAKYHDFCLHNTNFTYRLLALEQRSSTTRADLFLFLLFLVLKEDQEGALVTERKVGQNEIYEHHATTYSG